jgi:shikimate kinase
MRLIIVGPAYAGKTTLASTLRSWIEERTGDSLVMLHDHFLPSVGEGAPGRFTAEEEETEFAKLAPFALEKYMRYMIHYHLGHHFYIDNDHLVVDWYYADAVYAPLYFGYGGRGQYADRQAMARSHDAEVMALAPDTVIVHVTADPEVLRARMRAEPRPNLPLKEEDLEEIRDRFAEEFGHTLIRRRITLDTTDSTPEATFRELMGKLGQHLSAADRLRLSGGPLVS